MGALHESVLKRIHVAARVKQHLHDSLGSRGVFQNASILAFVSPRFCLQSLSFAILSISISECDVLLRMYRPIHTSRPIQSADAVSNRSTGGNRSIGAHSPRLAVAAQSRSRCPVVSMNPDITPRGHACSVTRTSQHSGTLISCRIQASPHCSSWMVAKVELLSPLPVAPHSSCSRVDTSLDPPVRHPIQGSLRQFTHQPADHSINLVECLSIESRSPIFTVNRGR